MPGTRRPDARALPRGPVSRSGAVAVVAVVAVAVVAVAVVTVAAVASCRGGRKAAATRGRGERRAVATGGRAVAGAAARAALSLPLMVLGPLVLPPRPAPLAVVLLPPVAFIPELLPAPVLVVAGGRQVREPVRHALRLNVDEGCVRPAGAIPVVAAAAPVPAADEEDLLVLVLHHLDAGLDHHQRRRHRQADLDRRLDLRAGSGGQEGQGEREREDEPVHEDDSTLVAVPRKR